MKFIPPYNYLRPSNNCAQDKIRWGIIIFVVILVFLWSDGLKLKISDLSQGTKTEWSKNYVVFALIATTLTLAVSRTQRFPRSWYSRSLYIVALIVLFPILFTSIRMYDQPVSVLWRRPFLFGSYLIFPFLAMVNLTPKEMTRLFYAILIIPAIGGILCGLGYFIPTIYNWFLDSEVSSRFGLVRLYISPDFTKLLLFLGVAMIINSPRPILKLAGGMIVYLLLWVLINIWLTRQVIYGVLGGIILVWFFKTKPRQKLVSILVILVVITVLGTFELLEPDSFFLRNFALMNDLTSAEFKSASGTIGNRLLGLDYFLRSFINTGFVGLGMSVAESVNDPISRGEWQYRFNINDLGMLGMVFSFGLPVLVFLFVMFRRLFRDLLIVVANTNGHHKIIADTILIYLLGEVAGLPFTKAFFYPKSSFFYGLLIYFTWRLMQPDMLSGQQQAKANPQTSTIFRRPAWRSRPVRVP
ncbi:MAG: hypothetical protein ONB16_02420 [candidate division KSB1 bacterium]|nr:hypothetical protein [candidate division KSB1 bacterium]MDZ7319914.1 hypothetical protein [candidate division KSB1 bacterium]MDZ7342464.1 hypothetical protein [candidate division KSB1 bacterium]